jgi:hypothetical protein
VSLTSDARAIVTGFMSVRVLAGTVETRGLFDDAESAVPTGDGMMTVIRGRALTVVGADLPDLAREDTIQVGAIEDDNDLTSYRVVDIQRMADGIIWQVVVAA